ncbi:MbtH family protein [Streptomyces naphthomycinicus]|uniref:MbtH family protein n=1 Tax=Streptomyces naphthomycinicus TaxID=2872625 RepID=UPI001CECD668|nr:MbtH family NRPS accessory protein [Streptomyces sp. TML10]
MTHDDTTAAAAESAAERPTHRVVRNDEEQYSVWWVDRELPPGWSEEGFRGSEEACLAHVDVVWTDMRPLSLRRRMEQRP